MADFWSSRLGVEAAPAPRPEPVRGPAAPGAWWQTPVQEQAYEPPVQPMQQEYQPEPQGTWGTVEGSLKNAKSSKINTNCPECNSGNYLVTGKVTTLNGVVEAWRCYDCGYPLVQSGSGMGQVDAVSSGVAQAARQLTGAGGGGLIHNFHPDVIVDRITSLSK